MSAHGHYLHRALLQCLQLFSRLVSQSSVDHDAASKQLGHPREEHEPRARVHVCLVLCCLGDIQVRLQTLLLDGYKAGETDFGARFRGGKLEPPGKWR